jgi:hypothetical protein
MKTKNASALVFALIILSIVLVSALSVSAITATERRSSGATDTSVESFQVADSGAEIVLNQIYKGSNATVSSLVSSLGATCNSDGSISGSIDSGKNYTVNLYKNDGSVESCNSTDSINNIVNIKSTGSYSQTSRAINVAVADGGLTWQNATLLNGWSNYGNGYQNVQYALDNRTGIVYLRGLASIATYNSSAIFQLPVGYRPQSRLTLTGWQNSCSGLSNYCAGRIDILTDGTIYSYTQPAGTNIAFGTFDNMSFSIN